MEEAVYKYDPLKVFLLLAPRKITPFYSYFHEKLPNTRFRDSHWLLERLFLHSFIGNPDGPNWFIPYLLW